MPKLISGVRCLPGVVCEEKTVRDIQHIFASDHNHDCWQQRTPLCVPNTIQERILIKNDFETQIQMSDSFQCRGSLVQSLDDKSFEKYVRSFQIKTHVYGAGGNEQKTGTHAKPASAINVNQEASAAVGARAQSFDLKANKVMRLAMPLLPLVALFIPFKPPLRSARNIHESLKGKDLVQFLGMFEFNSMYQEEGFPKHMWEGYIANSGLFGDDQLENATFLMKATISFVLTPYFPGGRLAENPERDTNALNNVYGRSKHPLKTLLIERDDKQMINVQVVPSRPGGFVHPHEFMERVVQEVEDKAIDPRMIETAPEHSEALKEVGELSDAQLERLDLGKMTEKRKVDITVEKFFPMLIRLAASGWYRLLRNNVSEDNRSVGYLTDKKYEKLLGTLFMCTPFPFPVRVYDVGTGFFMLQVENTLSTEHAEVGKHLYGDKKLAQVLEWDTVKKDCPELRDRILLSSILVRYFGNVEALHLFFCLDQKAATPCIQLFDVESAALFADFVFDHARRDGHTDDVKSLFWSEQMQGSLPPELGRDAERAKGFILGLTRMLPNLVAILDAVVEDPADLKANGQSCCVALMNLRNELNSQLQEEWQKTDFLCLQVMADLNSVFAHKPFGDEKMAVFCFKGYGGDAGLHAWDVSKEAQKEHKLPIQLEQFHVANNKTSYGKFCAIDESVKRELLCAKETFLDVLGLKSFEVDGHRVIGNKYNGMPISSVFTEHAPGCKNEIVLGRSVGTRNTNTPQPSRYHLHPTPTEGLFPMSYKSVAEEATKAFELHQAEWKPMHKDYLAAHDRAMLEGNEKTRAEDSEQLSQQSGSRNDLEKSSQQSQSQSAVGAPNPSADAFVSNGNDSVPRAVAVTQLSQDIRKQPMEIDEMQEYLEFED